MNIDLKNIIAYLYEVVTFEVFIKFVVLYFFIIWITILLWVMKDIWNRTNNIFLKLLAIFIILFLTPLWIFIYLIIRPTKTLFEKQYEEIEDNLAVFNQIVDEKTSQCEKESHCFNCNKPVNFDFIFCPNCKVNLKNKCTWCNKIIHSDWKICPYCWLIQVGDDDDNNIIDVDNKIEFNEQINKKVKKILSKI